MVADISFKNQSNYFKLHLNVLMILGIAIFPIKNKILRKIHPIRSILQLFFVIPEIILLLVNGYLVSHQLSGFVYAISSCLLTIFAIFKGIFLQMRNKKIGHYMNKIEHDDIFKPKLRRSDLDESELVKSAIRQFELIAKLTYGTLLIGVTISSITTWLTPIQFLEVFDKTTNSTIHKRFRPFVSCSSFPFGLEFIDSPAYDLMQLYQVISTFMMPCSIVAEDGIVCGFMIYIRMQFLILGHRVRYFGKFAKDQAQIREQDVKNRSFEDTDEAAREFSEGAWESPERILISCVQHHQQLLTFCQEIDNEFSVIMVLQLIGSTCITFCMMFILSTNLNNSAALSYIFYLNWTILQIFTYCYFGNEIQLSSSGVAECIFESNWTGVPESTKKILLLMILRSQRPCRLTAGKFQDFNLQSFVSIMKGALSYFMALLTLSRR